MILYFNIYIFWGVGGQKCYLSKISVTEKCDFLSFQVPYEAPLWIFFSQKWFEKFRTPKNSFKNELLMFFRRGGVQHPPPPQSQGQGMVLKNQKSIGILQSSDTNPPNPSILEILKTTGSKNPFKSTLMF